MSRRSSVLLLLLQPLPLLLLSGQGGNAVGRQGGERVEDEHHGGVAAGERDELDALRVAFKAVGSKTLIQEFARLQVIG